MNNKEKLYLVKQALDERLDQFGYGEDADQYLALKGGEITPEEAEILKEELPSALGTGLASGALSGLGTAGLTYFGNESSPGLGEFSAKTGLGVGGGVAILAAIMQAIENASTRSNIDESIKN